MRDPLDLIMREFAVNASASCIMRIVNLLLRRQKCQGPLGIVLGIVLGALQLLLETKGEGVS